MIEKLFNLKEYSIGELSVFGVGCFFWFVVYVLLLKNIHKNKIVEMPWVVVCGNISWEFLWGFVFIPNLGDFFTWAYRGWFFIDLYILYGTYKYGDKQMFVPELKQYFKPILTFCLCSWLLLLYFFIGKYDDPIGALSAFVINIIISILYIPMVLRSKDLLGISYLAAWSKMLGTALVAVFAYIHWPNNHMLLSLGAVIFILDASYICIYRYKKKQLAF